MALPHGYKKTHTQLVWTPSQCLDSKEGKEERGKEHQRICDQAETSQLPGANGHS